MSDTDQRRAAFDRLLTTGSPDDQLALRKGLRGDGYYSQIQRLCLNNPFFKLLDDEVAHLAGRNEESQLDRLILARDAASKLRTPKVSVFCMPKSGSSFVQSALQTAFELPFVSVTSVANPRISSIFGMNSREQELDELAIVKSILASPTGFVSQAHTRCSPYLAGQLRFYGIAPVLTVRNILDCIISFDEMMISWRTGRPEAGWISDAQFPLPLNYPDLDDQARYELLARSFGTWLIGFYLSWRRCIRETFVDPIVLRYEEDVLDPARFVRRMADRIPMTPAQLKRLDHYAHSPNRGRSRMNVGVRGRGSRIDERVVAGLLDYARNFAGELTDEEIRYLIR